MDAKPHYFKIGIFVLVAVVLIVVAVVIFGAGLLAQNELHFESYFAESITGLSVGSPLEFRGVRVGHVREIGFVGNVYDLGQIDGVVSRYAPYVRVVTAVPRAKMPDFAAGQVEEVLRQMIERGARVRVTSNILTGQAYLEMNYLDPNRFPVEEVPWQPKYVRIPSAPGELTTLKDSIDNILRQMQEIDVKGLIGSLERVFTSLDVAVSDANLAEISVEARALLRESRAKVAALETEKINAAAQQLLASLNQAVTDANIPQLSRQMQDVLAEMDRKLIALDMKRINTDIERLLDSLNQSVADANVPALSQDAQTLMAELRTTNQYLQSLLSPPEGAPPPNLPDVVARLGKTVSRLNTVLAAEKPQIETILSDLRELTNSLNELISTLKAHPSELLFSSPPRRSEVLK